MNYISSLLKSPFEKLFGLSNLKVDKDPFVSDPNSQTIQYRFNGTYENKSINIILLNNTETMKKLVLSKHNSFLPLIQFKSSEFTYQTSNEKINGNFLCLVVPSYSPVMYSKLEYIDCLQLLRAGAEFLHFLYDTLELQLSQVDLQTLSFIPASSDYVFTGFDQVTTSGIKSSKAIQQLISVVNSKQEHQFENIAQKPQNYLTSSTFNDPVFKIITEIDDISKLKDPLYIKQLLEAVSQLSMESLFSCLLQKLIKTAQTQPTIIPEVYPVFIKSCNLCLEKQKAHLIQKHFNSTFDFICQSVKLDQKLYIRYFIQLKNIQFMTESAANNFAQIGFQFIMKNAQNATEMPQILDYFIQLIQKNTVLLCRTLDLNQVLNHFANQISAFSATPSLLISWNAYLSISNLLRFNFELKQKCATYNELSSDTFIGITPASVWKSKLPDAIANSINSGNYDFVQAVYLLNLILPENLNQLKEFKVENHVIGQMIASLNSVRCLHLGVLSTNQKQRDMVREVIQKLWDLGYQLQQELEMKMVNESQAQSKQEQKPIKEVKNEPVKKQQPKKETKEEPKNEIIEEKTKTQNKQKINEDVKWFDQKDSDEEWAPAQKEIPTKKRGAQKVQQKTEWEDSEDEEEKQSKNAKETKAKDEDSDEEYTVKPKTQQQQQKEPRKQTQITKTKALEDSDEEFTVKPKITKKSQPIKADSDDEFDTKLIKAKPKVDTDSDEEFSPKQKPSKQQKEAENPQEVKKSCAIKQTEITKQKEPTEDSDEEFNPKPKQIQQNLVKNETKKLPIKQTIEDEDSDEEFNAKSIQKQQEVKTIPKTEQTIKQTKEQDDSDSDFTVKQKIQVKQQDSDSDTDFKPKVKENSDDEFDKKQQQNEVKKVVKRVVKRK
ncbi:Conserved_hypothetical protein [Hexamita inflata]|uniref:Uncharacterized protein n=1 Tax=Hexamita inflata TaxID=28002 RepID=A0AA86QLH7_9EUKA|nr:Conserved hypothetical protein [Hexamita inflata]